MALATADAGRPPVGADGAAEGPRAGRLRFLHQSRQPQGRASSPPTRRRRLLFHWKSLRRQVRVEGPVEPVTDEEADAYFAEPQPRIRSSAPGRPTSRARSTAARPFEQRYEELAAALRRPGRAAAAALVGLPPDRPSASNSGPTGRTACTSGAVHPRRRRLERRPALPVSARHRRGRAHGDERSS